MRIISRAEWGAAHDDGFGTAPLPAREVWLHHSVTVAPDLSPPFTDDDAAIRTLERIGESRFGRGISYTFLITPVGRIYEGHGIARQGAHTRNRNSISRAICLVGNYDLVPPTQAQLDVAAWLLREGKTRGWWTAARLTGGHRDAPGAATACPGRHAHALIAEINRRATTHPTPQEDTMDASQEAKLDRLLALLEPVEYTQPDGTKRRVSPMDAMINLYAAMFYGGTSTPDRMSLLALIDELRSRS